MIPSPCGIDVSAFVQKSGCSPGDSTFLKLVISSDDEITIFQDDVSLKTFKYDNICNQDSQKDVLKSLAKSVTKDVVESINRIMFVYKLSGNYTTHAVDMKTISSVMLNSIFGAVNSENNCDMSLHISCIEVNNKGINDLMQKCYTTSNDVKVFELANQTGSILMERIVTNAEDIDKIGAVFQETTPITCLDSIACLDCHHTIVFSTVVVKTRNNDGFEVLKTGRFILVDVEGCAAFLKEVMNHIRSRRESFYLVRDASPVAKGAKFWNCSLNGILKNFLCISKMSVMMTLPSMLFDLELVHDLEIVSEMQNLSLRPVFNERLILRESLKDYADEIKALEKDLVILKNNNGIKMSQLKYRSLKNRLFLSETQLKDMHEERNTISNSVSNKKETLTRFQQEIKLTSIKIEEEMQKLTFSKATLDEIEQEKIALNLKKMEKVDACVLMNNLINSNVNYVKNQNSYLLKIKYAYEKSSSSARLLNEDINNYTMITIAEQNKLKDKIESLLMHLKEILLNSTVQQNNFILNINEFYQKFEEILKLWKQHSTSLIFDFQSFMRRILHNCSSLRNNLCSELVSLNFREGAIIEIMKKNEIETLHMTTSCSKKIHITVENSIKLLYEVLCLLEISQGKIEEQLKKLESAICYHSNERMKFLNSTNSTMAAMHHYFNVQLNLSSEINSDIFSHHQELKLSVNQEFMKIKEALDSLKKLFCIQQKFVIDKWQQRQTYLSNVKDIGGVSESLKKCSEEHPIVLDKLRQQCVSSIDELYSILRDKTSTVDNLGSQLKNMFNEIECSITDCSEGNKKLISHQKNDIQDNLEIQNKNILKCINTTRSLVENFIQYITGGLQNTKNSFFNVKDLMKKNDANFILELRDNLQYYIKKYGNIFELSELTLQQLPETVPKQAENLEDSVEFNHEELLSSTPSSHQERHKNLINDKTKFLNRLRKIAEIQVNSGCQDNISLDQESIMNTTTLSLPNMSTRAKVEIHTNRNLTHRRLGK